MLPSLRRCLPGEELPMNICIDHGRSVIVKPARSFGSGFEVGIGQERQGPYGLWFVYARTNTGPWHKHCGPYSTEDQAVDWIRSIRE